MSRPVKRGAFKRSCRACGWSGTYDTAGRGDWAKRQHSCEKNLRDAASHARGEARRQQWSTIDRTPKPCLHKQADHQHGAYATYTLDGCRCAPCTEAANVYERQRVRDIAYGRADLVDADPVRAHLTVLKEYGIGLKHVSRISGVSNGSLTKIVYGRYAPVEGPQRGRYGAGDLLRGPAARVRKSTAARILAVQPIPENLPAVRSDRERTPLARLQLRALVALGWSQSKVAKRLGKTPANFGLVINGDQPMARETVDAVTALYAELSMTLPPNLTHRDKISVSRARRHAKANGWLPPLDLEAMGDDYGIESDDALDETAIFRRMDGDKSVRLTKAEKVELVRRWVASGRSLHEMERFTGVHSHRYQREAS